MAEKLPGESSQSYIFEATPSPKYNIRVVITKTRLFKYMENFTTKN